MQPDSSEHDHPTWNELSAENERHRIHIEDIQTVRHHLAMENLRLREALERIERLAAKWGAPPEYGDAEWSAVGSEAHKIATLALNQLHSPD